MVTVGELALWLFISECGEEFKHSVEIMYMTEYDAGVLNFPALLLRISVIVNRYFRLDRHGMCNGLRRLGCNHNLHYYILVLFSVQGQKS